MLLYPTFIPNQNNYNMLGIKLGIKKIQFLTSHADHPDSLNDRSHEWSP